MMILQCWNSLKIPRCGNFQNLISSSFFTDTSVVKFHQDPISSFYVNRNTDKHANKRRVLDGGGHDKIIHCSTQDSIPQWCSEYFCVIQLHAQSDFGLWHFKVLHFAPLAVLPYDCMYCTRYCMAFRLNVLDQLNRPESRWTQLIQSDCNVANIPIDSLEHLVADRTAFRRLTCARTFC